MFNMNFICLMSICLYFVFPDDARCDVWSIGVIAYMLLSGTPPFNGKRDKETLAAVKAGQWKFHEKLFRPVGAPAKAFITCCLTPLADRSSAEDMLKHPWFLLLTRGVKAEPISLDVIARLRGLFFSPFFCICICVVSMAVCLWF